MTEGLPCHQQDILTFCYTSGTTGDPKGVLLTSATQWKLLAVLQQDTILNATWPASAWRQPKPEIAGVRPVVSRGLKCSPGTPNVGVLVEEGQG